MAHKFVKACDYQDLISEPHDTHKDDLENRIFWIDTEINTSYLNLVKNIIDCNREDIGLEPEERVPIKIMIMSPGGDMKTCNALIDTIKLSKTPVYGYNIGYAASCGCFIFIACHRRFALQNSVFVLHKGSADVEGTYDEIQSFCADYTREINNLMYFVHSNSGIPKDVLREKLTNDWYLSADKAYSDYKFVDEIIDDIECML